jgi:hypothetical protein
MDDLDDWFYNLLAVLSRLIAAELHQSSLQRLAMLLTSSTGELAKTPTIAGRFLRRWTALTSASAFSLDT